MVAVCPPVPPRITLPETVTCDPELKSSVPLPLLGLVLLPSVMLAQTAFDTFTVSVAPFLTVMVVALVGVGLMPDQNVAPVTKTCASETAGAAIRMSNETAIVVCREKLLRVFMGDS